jgi:hypothetical protein
MGAVPGELARLAFEASLRRLDKQEQSLGEIRARTGLILAASSLGASFLARPALDADPIGLALLALLAFGVSVGASLYVLLPKKELVFSLIGSRTYEELYEFRENVEEVHRRLAYDLDRFWDANDSAMQGLLWWFRVATGALAAEIAILLTALTGSLGT